MPDEDASEPRIERTQSQRRTDLVREAIVDQARDVAEKSREHGGSLIAAAVVVAGAVGAVLWRRRS